MTVSGDVAEGIADGSKAMMCIKITVTSLMTMIGLLRFVDDVAWFILPRKVAPTMTIVGLILVMMFTVSVIGDGCWVIVMAVMMMMTMMMMVIVCFCSAAAAGAAAAAAAAAAAGGGGGT